MALDQYNEEEEDENGMSFLDHLEQLRWHLLRSISAILIFMVLAFLSKGFVFGQVILGPSKQTNDGAVFHAHYFQFGGRLDCCFSLCVLGNMEIY